MEKQIKDNQVNSWSLERIKKKLLKMYHDNNSVLEDCALTNTRRIYYLSMIAIPLRIIDIVLFSSKSYDTAVLKTWSQGIIITHFVLLIIMIAFFLMAYKLRKREKPNITIYILQYTVVIAIMASGVIFVTIDQLVTTNITPLLLTCIVVGLIFLIRPLISLVIFMTTYVAYYYLIAITLTDQQLLLSNRVNGITAIGIGFLLSIIIWNYNYTIISQKRRIEIQQNQLEHMAYHDSLTDLPNRHLFDKLIKQELSLIKCCGHETVLIILDVDNFKRINDTYGHPVGDELLRQLADLLSSNVRQSDTVCRFGGDEFIIILPNTSLEEGYALAERLRKIIMNKRFILDLITLQITSSFGISVMNCMENRSIEDYYSSVDKALYLAKQKGKNRVEIAKESMS
jgi:diguanylate cyclase (GGDEF)-like protein